MDPNFWFQRWENNEIAFHLPDTNPVLVKHFGALSLPAGSRVFVPLCGKTRDIAWLLSQGYRVAGAELVGTAIQQLFDDLKLKPKVTQSKTISHYAAPNLDIFAGDIFNLTPDTLGPVDATYDRAALVALPEPMRQDYTTHMIHLTAGSPQLLITYEYDQNQMDGPPFSIPTDEVRQKYGSQYNATILETINLPSGLKGKAAANETIWHLSKTQ